MYEQRLSSTDVLFCFEIIWTCDPSQIFVLLTNPLLIMMAHVNARGRMKMCARGVLGFDIKGHVTIVVALTKKVKKTNNKHDKQCTHKIISRCFLVTNVAMETQNFTTCVFVSGL
jgi:hypothetical protein